MSKTQKIPEPAAPATRIWTSLDLLKWTTEFFKKKNIENPRLESELLLSEALGWPRIRLYSDFEKPIDAEKLARFREFVKRRGESREPLQYIVGHTQFIDLKIKVTPAVLIPRPETESLAAWAVERCKEITRDRLLIADVCTGSGCIALYIASKEPRARAAASDISKAALEVAAENVQGLHCEDKIELLESDLFLNFPEQWRGQFDLIVSNPPYVDPADSATLQPEVVQHEPAAALFAQKGGLEISQRLIAQAHQWLRPGGWLGIEFGLNQSEALKKFIEMTDNYVDITIQEDVFNRPRFALARLR